MFPVGFGPGPACRRQFYCGSIWNRGWSTRRVTAPHLVPVWYRAQSPYCGLTPPRRPQACLHRSVPRLALSRLNVEAPNCPLQKVARRRSSDERVPSLPQPPQPSAIASQPTLSNRPQCRPRAVRLSTFSPAAEEERARVPCCGLSFFSLSPALPSRAGCFP